MSRFPTVLCMVIVLAAALSCGEEGEKPAGGPGVLVVDYPRDGSVFPPEFIAPTFHWHDDARADYWQIDIAFQDGGADLVLRADGDPVPEPVIDPDAIRGNNEVYRGTDYQRSALTFIPSDEEWQAIKDRCVESVATLRFSGRLSADPDQALSRGEVHLSVSKDPVGAPIFYRDVPLMPAIGKKGAIKPLADDAISLIA